MNATKITAVALLASLVLLSGGLAQEAGPDSGDGSPGGKIPERLEEMLEIALRTNPDLVLAEAKAREAQAELSQARLRVTQKVATLFHERKRLMETKSSIAARVRRLHALYGTGNASQEEVAEAVLAQADADAKLAQTEAEIRYVLGLGSVLKITFSERLEVPPPRGPGEPEPGAVRPAIPDSVRRVLMEEMTVDWERKPLPAVLQALQAATGNQVAFLLGPDLAPEDAAEYAITLEIPGPVQISAILTAVTDYLRFHEFCFVFREYGVVLTDYDHAADMMAATVPADVPLRRR
jgi:hypothetical protein